VATGAFFNALAYKFYVKKGTTASAAPSSASGLVEVLSLTNAGIQGTSETQNVLDYGSTLGFTNSIVTSQGYEIPCTMNLDLRDAGYKELKEAAKDAATGVTVQWYRESPEMTSVGDPEKHAGVAFVTNFSEQIEAGTIAQVTFTLSGYGAYTWTAETDTEPPAPSPG
jgi:hypothetical protein